jgi:hypothetical protein
MRTFVIHATISKVLNFLTPASVEDYRKCVPVPGEGGRHRGALGRKSCWQFKCIQIPCREQEMGPTFAPNKNSGPATGMESQNRQSVPEEP